MLFLLIRSIHVLAAIWFCCGIAGYLTARLAALRAEDVHAVDALVKMMGRFRNLMVRPGGGLLVIFGLWAAYDEAWPRFSIHAIILLVILVPFMVLMVNGSHKLEAASAEAVKSGSVTLELNTAMRARPLVIAEYAVGVITILFLLLMLLKPA